MSGTFGIIGFRAVTQEDYGLLGDWMARPHWREWWGEPDEELGFVRDMVEGRDTTCRPFIFSIEDEPSGYIQVWQVGPHQVPEWTDENPWLLQVPPDAVGIDLSLSDGERLGRGLGSAVLSRFVVMLREAGHDTILIDPDPANARAVRAYEKAGFRRMDSVTEGTDRALIMRHEIA